MRPPARKPVRGGSPYPPRTREAGDSGAVGAQTHRGKGSLGAVLAAVGIMLAAAGSASASAPAPPPNAHSLTARAFRSAAASVRPSVVRIETYGGVVAPTGPAPQPRREDEGDDRPRPRRRGRRIRALGRPGEGPTTGLILSPDGLILTSTFALAAEPPVITVGLADGSRHVARLLGRDDTRAVCLLKIEGVADLPVPQFVPRQRLRVGQWAVAVGVGYGAAQPALSAGIVSALHRIFGRAVQTDANLSPANYGGPLVDIDGRVIGLCVPLSPMPGPGGTGGTAGMRWYDSGIGFAIPLAGLEPVIERLAHGEVIRHGRLGVRPGPVQDAAGARIQEVVEGSPAAKAGLAKDDVLVAVDGQAVRDVSHLRLLIGRHVAGETVVLTVRRGDADKEVPVRLEAGREAVPPPRPVDLGGDGRDTPSD